MNRKQLEERLIDFAVIIAGIINEMPNTKFANHLASQLIRKSTSPALNYGEAQGAESKKDFVHKMSLVLKELRESHICLKILMRTQSFHEKNTVQKAIRESNELISIFYRSIQTASSYGGNIKKDRKSLRR
jgi:four helix bundle protein